MMSAEERYQRDPVFHALVDSIYMMIVRLELTPTETREAAMLAQLKYEQNHVRPFYDPALGRFWREDKIV